MTRHYLPAMVKRGWGRVVFISSESGVNIPKEMIDYGMTKTAQLAISRGLAESVAGSGVTVNAVLPGPTRSEGLSRYVMAAAEAQGVTQDAVEQQFLTQMRPTSLIKRFATLCASMAASSALSPNASSSDRHGGGVTPTPAR